MTFVSLLGIECHKLLKHPLAWLELAGVPAILTLYFAARYLTTGPLAKEALLGAPGWEADLHGGLELFRIAGILFYASAAGFIAAYDLPERGIQAWLVRGIPRPLVILSRFVLILLVGWLIAAVAALASLGEGALARTLFLGGYGAGNPNWAQVFPSIMQLFWGAAPYLGLALLLAIGSRSPLFAAGGAIVFRTVVENILLGLSDRFPTVIRYLPAQLDLALQSRASADEAAMLIGMFLAIFAVLSLVIFSRQDWGG